MRWRLWTLLFCVTLLGGCRKQSGPTPGGSRIDAAVAPVRPAAVAAPRPVPVTPAQQAFDGEHVAALRVIVSDLHRLYGTSLVLQRAGARDPKSRVFWSKEREKLVAEAGRVRAKVLAVDPLSNRSWAAARALTLLHYLTVKLPDAIRESWRSRPSGAFKTWKGDFRLIFDRLRRYVKSYEKQDTRFRPKDTK